MSATALARLRAALGAHGLHIVQPVTQPALDRAGLDLPLARWLPEAGGAVIVGDGGTAFFARFRADCPDADPGGHPLDGYTARVIPAAVAAALPAVRFAVRFPFGGEGPPVPFQRLGAAAGLPPPGPLGIQVHPRFGPWWGYRAFVVVDLPLDDEPPLDTPCTGCPAPCVAVCPADALAGRTLDVHRCASHRLAADACARSCAAREACIAGPAHRYPPDQLAFHMDASLRTIRGHSTGGP